jgi:NADPH:quinone reductase-like Zn-dependent oxidoreductase
LRNHWTGSTFTRTSIACGLSRWACDEATRRAGRAPGGVDGLIDAAVLDAAVLPAIRDGGKLATVRGFAGPSERGITIEPVRVTSYLHNQEALDRLGRLVAEKRLTLRVAETFPPERAADAQRKMAAGGTRGRLVIVF